MFIDLPKVVSIDRHEKSMKNIFDILEKHPQEIVHLHGDFAPHNFLLRKNDSDNTYNLEFCFDPHPDISF